MKRKRHVQRRHLLSRRCSPRRGGATHGYHARRLHLHRTLYPEAHRRRGRTVAVQVGAPSADARYGEHGCRHLAAFPRRTSHRVLFDGASHRRRRDRRRVVLEELRRGHRETRSRVGLLLPVASNESPLIQVHVLAHGCRLRHLVLPRLLAAHFTFPTRRPRRDRRLQQLVTVLFAQQVPVDHVVPVPWHQLVVALGTRETLQVIHIALRSHHKLAGRNRLTARRTRTRVAKNPDVIVFAEYHPSPREARAADVGERGTAARALETRRVPVSVHRVQQKAVTDLAAAAATTAHVTSVVGHSNHRRTPSSAARAVAWRAAPRRSAARSHVGRRRSATVRHPRVHDRPVTVPSESVGRVMVHARSSASPLLLNPDGGAASVQLAALLRVSTKHNTQKKGKKTLTYCASTITGVVQQTPTKNTGTNSTPSPSKRTNISLRPSNLTFSVVSRRRSQSTRLTLVRVFIIGGNAGKMVLPCCLRRENSFAAATTPHNQTI